MTVWNPDFWYMPGIYLVYTIHMEMSSIWMVYTWYIQGYTMYIHGNGYTMYIQGYTWYIHYVYARYMPGICLTYHLTDIHGISLDILGYPWIFLSF